MPMSPRLLRPRSAGGGFDPRQISGLQAWYDFSDASTLTIDTGITSVRDKSGNNLTASEAVGANQPLLVANARNGLSAADFDGTNDKLTTASIVSDLTQFTSFLVVRPQFRTGLTGLERMWTRNDVTRSVGMNGNVLRIWLSASVFADSVSNSLPDSSWAYVRGAWNGTLLANSMSGAVNGTSFAGPATDFGSVSSVANTPLCIGNRASDGARAFDGLIGEFVIYSRALTASETAEVEKGMKAKWGFT